MSRRWQAAVAGLAALKIILGMAVLPLRWNLPETPSEPIPLPVLFINALAFGGVGALLIFGRSRDRRPFHLGTVFVLFGSLFSNRLLLALSAAGVAGSPLAALLASLRVDAFLPLFFWLFVADFPRDVGFGLRHSLSRFFQAASLAAGAFLFVANGLALTVSDTSTTAGMLRAFGPGGEVYWIVIILLTLPGLVHPVVRVRHAPPDEKRRVGLFIWGLVLGFGPMAFEVLLESFIPPFRRFMSTPEGYRTGAWVLYPLLLLAPVTTAYSVLVRHALGFRLVFRKALQYALARYAFAVVVVIPGLALALFVYLHRHQTLNDMASSGSAMAVLSASVAGIVVFVLRRRLFNVIDRWFFREEYDARQILTGLVGKCREADGVEELSSLLRREIESALHPQVVAVFFLDPETGHLVAGRAGFRPLDLTSVMATLLAGDTRPLSVELDCLDETLRSLPEDERSWIADGGFRLFVPLIADSRLLALLALGEKKSELPYSQEDRSLLTAIAAAGALNLEKRLPVWFPDLAMTPPMGRTRAADEAAMEKLGSALAVECKACHAVKPSGQDRCACGGRLVAAPIPHILSGKFRFKRRIGAGGMGIVYLAEDLALGRDVAVKTLPRMSSTYALRLRREARAIASLVHPNLATIFGAETWQGTPMLVFEYLKGGTLARKLEQSSLSPEAAADFGVVLADALQCIHAAGILHCDIKPSNIGFTADGTPKLLDFGLARILLDSQEQGALSAGVLETLPEDYQRTPAEGHESLRDSTLRIVGTPLYLSPEALRQRVVDVSGDLWGATMTLYEAVAGHHPLEGMSLRDALRRIARADLPHVRTFTPDCPDALACFLSTGLARDPHLRPATAREMKTRLVAVRASLGQAGRPPASSSGLAAS